MRLGAGLLVVVVLLFLYPALALAGVPPVPIEGDLLVSTISPSLPYVLHGTSEDATPIVNRGGITLSPLGDEISYSSSAVAADLMKANRDGSGETCLTTGLGGRNCEGRYSPDGSLISFLHLSRAPGQYPCENGDYSGIEVWVMNADGSNRRPVLTGLNVRPTPSWAPNGHRLLIEVFLEGSPTSNIVTVDVDDLDTEWLPFVGEYASSSPDGSRLAFTQLKEVGGYPGGDWAWRRELHVADLDGANDTVVAASELLHSVALTYLDVHGITDPEERAETEYSFLATYIGPYAPAWSPRGDRLAYISIPSFDPYYGELFELLEVSIVDVGSLDVTRITNNSERESWVQWNGNNTFDYDPEVTVDNTTVTFGTVTVEGLTNILWTDDPPPLPPGYALWGTPYQIKTTASFSGPFTVTMSYLDDWMPSGAAEADPCLWHHDLTSGWYDVTSERDTTNHIVKGTWNILSSFALVVPKQGTPRFSDVATDHWAFWYIEACVNAGVVGGYGDGTYRPSLTVDRAAMAVFISRALAGGDSLVPTGPATATFTDVPTDHWAFKYVEYVADNGVAGGYGDGTYRPTLTVDRGQMAVFMARAMCGGDASVPTGPETAFFPDVPTDHWAFRYVEYIRGEGVTGGYPDGTYRPLVACTRDQMAVYVQRAFSLT